MTEWLIIGARTTLAADVAEIIWRRQDVLVGVVDNLEEGSIESAPEVNPALGPVILPGMLSSADRDQAACIPQSTPGHRHVIATWAMKQGFHRFPALIDPSAVVARTSRYARGVIVNAGVVVAASAEIDEFVMVNRSASVGHDARIGRCSSIGPGAVLAGHVLLGEGAFVGAGAVIAPGVAIGPNAVVGAGSVVVRDVDANVVVVGNPSRVVRSGVAGHGGVGVP